MLMIKGWFITLYINIFVTAELKSQHTLAVSCKSGDIYLVENDDLASATVIRTNLTGK